MVRKMLFNWSLDCYSVQQYREPATIIPAKEHNGCLRRERESSVWGSSTNWKNGENGRWGGGGGGHGETWGYGTCLPHLLSPPSFWEHPKGGRSGNSVMESMVLRSGIVIDGRLASNVPTPVRGKGTLRDIGTMISASQHPPHDIMKCLGSHPPLLWADECCHTWQPLIFKRGLFCLPFLISCPLSFSVNGSWEIIFKSKSLACSNIFLST